MPSGAARAASTISWNLLRLNGLHNLPLVIGLRKPGWIDVRSVSKVMHRHCLAGDIFGSAGCACGTTLRASLQRIGKEAAGAVIYLHQNSIGFSVETAGNGHALNFHQNGRNSSQLEHQRRTQREVGIGAQILHDLNLRIRLLTNHPRRLPALCGYGIEIVEQVPVEFPESVYIKSLLHK